MNKTQRKVIALKSDEELTDDIERYYRATLNMGGHLRPIRRSVDKKLNALLAERQTRMLKECGK